MPDDIDLAQERAAEYTADALREHWRRQSMGQGLSHCEDCDELIPEARRKAMPGCRRCIDCQTLHEKRPALSGAEGRAL